LQWLYQVKKRFGLSILNYSVTSNHVHLLVKDKGGGDTISKSIQLIAGRTAQEYNQRKNRKGAFWEDRYHATCVETGHHLIQCLIYIDLNMVRTGAVRHPNDYPYCGYNEIQSPKLRYALIDYEELEKQLNFDSMTQLAISYRSWLEDALSKENNLRDSKWTQSVAVGSEHYVREVLEQLVIKARGRRTIESGGAFVLRESTILYNRFLGHENVALGS
jgi:putative transposase